jgi:hypothetical protein
MSNTYYCPNCGRYAPSGESCRNCGHRLNFYGNEPVTATLNVAAIPTFVNPFRPQYVPQVVPVVAPIVQGNPFGSPYINPYGPTIVPVINRNPYGGNIIIGNNGGLYHSGFSFW